MESGVRLGGLTAFIVLRPHLAAVLVGAVPRLQQRATIAAEKAVDVKIVIVIDSLIVGLVFFVGLNIEDIVSLIGFLVLVLIQIVTVLRARSHERAWHAHVARDLQRFFSVQTNTWSFHSVCVVTIFGIDHDHAAFTATRGCLSGGRHLVLRFFLACKHVFFGRCHIGCSHWTLTVQ